MGSPERAQAAAMAAASAAHCTAELLADVAALAISLLAAARDDAPQPLFNAVGPPRLRGAGAPDGFGVPGQMEGLQFGPTGITVLPGPVAARACRRGRRRWRPRRRPRRPQRRRGPHIRRGQQASS